METFSQHVDDFWSNWNKVALVTGEQRTADCLLSLRRIEEVDSDATFCGIQTSGFVRWFPPDLEMREVSYAGEILLEKLRTICIWWWSVSFAMQV